MVGMKLPLLPIVCLCAAANGQDITFTNRTVTFTNLQHQVYSNVTLVKADGVSLIWRDGASGGRALYTTLEPAFLVSLGIPTNRIASAKEWAYRKAQENAKYRQAWAIEAEREHQAQVARNLEYEAEKAKQAAMAQQQADLQAINDLAARIDRESAALDQAEANADDQSTADPNNIYYVPNDSKRHLAIRNEARQLQQMQADYDKKYKSSP